MRLSYLNRYVLHLLAAVLMTSVISVKAMNAQPVIDQEQLAYQYGYPLYAKWNTQSFSPDYSSSSGAGFLLQIGYPFGGPRSTTVMINLWTLLASSPDAVRLAGGTTELADIQSGTPTWADVFWDPVAVTPGQTYWLTLAITDTSFVSHVAMDYDGVEGEYYPRGVAGHTDWFIKYPQERSSYELQSAQDLVFRTYANVPEPSVSGLLLIGILTLGLIRKRSRRMAALK